MVMHGADAEALEALAQDMRNVAERLRYIEGHLVHRLGRTRWSGRDGDQFSADWHGRLRPAVQRISLQLSDEGEALRRQAAEQRAASASATGALAGASAIGAVPFLGERIGGLSYDQRRLLREHLDDYESGMTALPPELAAVPGIAWAVEHGREAIGHAAGLPADERARWWAGLSPERQDALLVLHPGLLTGLAGLPLAVQQRATDQYIESRLSEIVVTEASHRAEFQANVFKIVMVRGEVEATIREMADGRYEVELGVAGGMGVGGGAKVVERDAFVLGSNRQTYVFDSADQARAMVDGLVRVVEPSGFEARLLAFGGGGVIASKTAWEMERYLDGYSGARKSSVVGLEAVGSGEIDLGFLKVDTSRSAGAEYDLHTGQTTLFVDVSTALSALPIGQDVEARAELKLDRSGSLAGATIHVSASRGAHLSAEQLLLALGTSAPHPIDFRGDVAATVNVEASLDLRDPTVRNELRKLLGDRGDAVADLRGVLERSDVLVQLGMSSTSGVSFDVGVAEGGYEAEVRKNQITLLKPPGGAFVPVDTSVTARGSVAQ